MRTALGYIPFDRALTAKLRLDLVLRFVGKCLAGAY